MPRSGSRTADVPRVLTPPALLAFPRCPIPAAFAGIATGITTSGQFIWPGNPMLGAFPTGVDRQSLTGIG
jgi:hypothetical protein